MITHYSIHIDLLHIGKAFEVNYSLILALVVSAVYIYVDLVSGVRTFWRHFSHCSIYFFIKLVSTAIYVGSAFLTTHLYHTLVNTPYYEPYMKVMIVIHIASWLLQIAGHSFFEGIQLIIDVSNCLLGRTPAMVDNLYQVFIAPDFVVLEVNISSWHWLNLLFSIERAGYVHARVQT